MSRSGPRDNSSSQEVIYVSQAQIQSLLAKITSTRDLAIFTVGYWRGLRASEVGALNLTHWMPESSQLWVLRCKGSVSGVYTLSPPEIKALKSWLKVRGNTPGPLFPSRRGGGLSRQMLDRLTKEYGEKAGWPKCKCMFKVLRHSIATHLLEKGVEIYAVKDWLGHKSVKSTEVYAKITNPARQRAEKTAYQGESGSPESGRKAAPNSAPKVNWSQDRRRSRPVGGGGGGGDNGGGPTNPHPKV